MLALLLCFGASLPSEVPSLLIPSVQWASQPTLAGETVLLWGDSLGDVTHVNVSAAAGGPSHVVPTFDRSRTSLKATLPPALHDGVFLVCLGSNGTGSCARVNAPDPWWWRGDTNLTNATPAGWVRVFGRLSDEAGRLPAPSLALSPDPSGAAVPTLLPPTNATANSVLYRLPIGLAPGRFALSLMHGTARVGLAGLLTVAPPPAWPGPTIKVTVCAPHVKSPGCGNDALFAALNATRLAGGGTIILQQGVWQFTTETIDLPPFTALRGVGTSRVTLVWNTEDLNLTDVPKYFVGGNATFIVEDLSISCTRFYNNIITDGSRRLSDPWVPCQQGALPCDDASATWGHSRGVRIRRVRIRADCFFRLTERGGPLRRGLSANFTYEQLGAAINLNGQEYEVTDCDIYASMHGIYLGHNQGSLWDSASVYKGYDIILDHVSRLPQPCTTPHAPCDMLYLAAMQWSADSCLRSDGMAHSRLQGDRRTKHDQLRRRLLSDRRIEPCHLRRERVRRDQSLLPRQRRRLDVRWSRRQLHLLCAQPDSLRVWRRPRGTDPGRRLLALLWSGAGVRHGNDLPAGP